MMHLAGALLTTLILASSLAAQEARKPDDVVQLKAGQMLVGRVLKMGSDSVEMLVNGEREARRVAFGEILPYSLYILKRDRIDKTSGQARFDLGEFCMTGGLYSTAVREFEEALKLDKSLADRAQKRRDEAHHEDARSKFEEAKKLRAEKRYEDANKTLQLLRERYSDTPYADEARKETAKIAEEINKENEEKKKQLDDKARQAADAKARVKEDQDKVLLTKGVEHVEEAQRAWSEGLDHEPRNLSKADRAWRASEASLLAARRNVEIMLKSNDVDMIKKAKDLDRLIDVWLAKTYYRLGRMWSVELAYPVALEWLNKGMKTPHDEQMDHLLNEVLLTISQLQMRKRASGTGGY